MLYISSSHFRSLFYNACNQPHNNSPVISANTAAAALWENITSVCMVSSLLATFVICVCVCVCVLSRAPEITQEAGTEKERGRRSPTHRGKNSFLESYTSVGICLMSARVQRCIEHVRRPLARRCGVADSITMCDRSLCLPMPLLLSAAYFSHYK